MGCSRVRTKKRRFAVDKLFVLGAGASFSPTRPNASYSSLLPPQRQTPLDKHFTHVLAELRCGNPVWVNESVDTVNKSWRDHINFSSIGLEEAILTQSANMRFANAIRPRRGRKSIKFDEYVNHIAHLVTFYLRRARQGTEHIYDNFVKEHFSNTNTKNRIVTFNYDDVLDNILLKNHALKDVYFSQLKPSAGRAPALDGSESPLLLKLHGSVNWNCPSDDFQKIIMRNWVGNKPFFIEDIWYRNKGCPKSSDKISPCIIPPIESKPITSISLFRFLWTRACEYLHECRELYVCGYSLPPTDALAASLFKEFSNDRLETVTVVDPDPSVMTKWRKLLSRKNVKPARWVYYADFAEFTNNAA